MFRRNFEVFILELKDHFTYHKKWYLFLGILLILSIIVGIITACAMKEVSVSKIPDNVYQSYISGKSNIIKLAFGRLFNTLLLVLLILLLCFRREFALLSVGILCYRAFMLGVTITLVIRLFNVAGVLNVLLLIIPCYVLTLFLLVTWAILCIRYSFEAHSFGGGVFSREFWCMHKRTILILGLSILILAVLECLLLPMLSSTFLVSKT